MRWDEDKDERMDRDIGMGDGRDCLDGWEYKDWEMKTIGWIDG